MVDSVCNTFRRLRNSTVAASKVGWNKRSAFYCVIFLSSFSLTMLLTWPHTPAHLDFITYTGNFRQHVDVINRERMILVTTPATAAVAASGNDAAAADDEEKTLDFNQPLTPPNDSVYWQQKRSLNNSSSASLSKVQNIVRSLNYLPPKLHCNESVSWKLSPLPSRYEARRAVMTDYCKRRGVEAGTFDQQLQLQLTDNIYVNDELGFIFCRLPKVAVTNWKRVLLYLLLNRTSSLTRHVMKVKDSAVHKGPLRKMLESTRLSTFTYPEVLCRLRHYTKIVFVRHPLDRLLSAYKSKFVTRSVENVRNFFIPYGRDIIRYYRQSPSNISLTWGADVSFTEFLQSVLESPESELNRHWAPYIQQCYPCNIGYDFIGTYETMEEDANYLLDSWSVEKSVRFPQANRALPEEGCRYRDAFSRVPLHVIDGLMRKFRADFEMFGYDGQPRFGSGNEKQTSGGNSGSLMMSRRQKKFLQKRKEKEEEEGEMGTNCRAWLQADEQANQLDRAKWAFLDSDGVAAVSSLQLSANREALFAKLSPWPNISHFDKPRQ